MSEFITDIDFLHTLLEIRGIEVGDEILCNRVVGTCKVVSLDWDDTKYGCPVRAEWDSAVGPIAGWVHRYGIHGWRRP